MQCLKTLFICIAAFHLSACWDYTPLENALNITAIGVDVDEKNPKEIRVTFMGPQPSLTGNTSQTSNENRTSSNSYSITTASGKNIHDALRNVKNTSNQEVQINSLKLVVFSEKIAQNGLFPYVDALQRNPQVYRGATLCISRDKPVEVLSYESEFVTLIPMHIPDLIHSAEMYTYPQLFHLSHFTNAIFGENQSFALPIISIQKSQKAIQLEGTAIFKDGKLMDILDQNKAYSYFFFKKRLKNFELTAEAKKISPLQKGTLSFILYPQRHSVKPYAHENNIQFEIHFSVTGKVVEQSRDFNPLNVQPFSFFPNFHDENARFLAYEEFLKKHLSAILVQMLKKTQEEYAYDVFGFGALVRIQYPEIYAQKPWQETYKDAKFNVHLDVDLKSSGILFLR